MLRFKCKHRPERVLPGCYALPRQGAHQIDIDIVKSHAAGKPVVLLKLPEGMDPAEKPKLLIGGRLQPDAQAVYAALLPGRKLFLRDGSRIGLDGPFETILQWKMLPHRLRKSQELVRMQKGRGSAADKNRRNHFPPYLRPRRHLLHLRHQLVQVRIHLPGGAEL